MKLRTLTATFTIAVLLLCVTHAPPTRAIEPVTTTAIIISAIFFLVEQGINYGSLPKTKPRVGPITVNIDNTGQWFVGGKRDVHVSFDASFGSISGKQVGKLKVQVKLGTKVMDEEVRKYTKKGDGKSSTITLGSNRGRFQFKLGLQAAKVAQNEMFSVYVRADGESGKWWWPDKKAHDTEESDPFPLVFQFPFDKEPSSSKIGWLSPAAATHGHNQCFDQSLRVKSLTPASWRVVEGRLGDKKAGIKKTGKGTFEVVSNQVGHYEDDNCPLPFDICSWHVSDEGYTTGWDLSRGGSSDNIRVYLAGGKEWRDDGDNGPSQDENNCTGSFTSVPNPDCFGTDYEIVPPPNVTFTQPVELQLISFQDPAATVGAGWDLAFTGIGGNPGSPLASWTTDSNGSVSVSVADFAPVVDVYLVPPMGVSSDYFDADSLFRTQYPLAPLPDTLYILEKEGPRITGQVIDNQPTPVDLEADVVVINPQTSEETRFGVSGSFDLGPIGLTKLGYPTTNIRIEVEPRVNRAYTLPSIDRNGESTTGTTIDLGPIVFDEAPHYPGIVTFTGDALVRNYLDASEVPIVGMNIVVNGSDQPTDPPVAFGSTDGFGHFSIDVPAGPYWVHFTNAGDLLGPNGRGLDAAAFQTFPLEFGRGGSTLDMGELVVDEVGQVIPALPPAGLIILLVLVGAGAIWVLRRRLI